MEHGQADDVDDSHGEENAPTSRGEERKVKESGEEQEVTSKWIFERSFQSPAFQRHEDPSSFGREI